MPRITTYQQDSTPSLDDKWIGTDSQTSQTRNYSISSVIGLINDNTLIDQFDGVKYNFTAYSAAPDPQGILFFSPSSTNTTALSSVTSVYLSKTAASGDTVSEYIDAFETHWIKINVQGDLNTFGIYRVTAIEDYQTNYKKLTVSFLEGNGSLNPNNKLFVSNYQAVLDRDFSDNSVTEFGDVTSAGSGQIITNSERTNYNEVHANAVRHSDVVDNVLGSGTDVPLSANQGRILKGYIDSINTLLSSDDTTLDELQEIVDFIKANKDELDNLGISNISGLQDALDSKVDKIVGKQLSEEDFTTVLKNKLDGIEAEAEVNVQADWNQSINTDDSFIQNKPTDVTDLSLHSVTELNDVNDQGSGYIITDLERTRLEDDLVEKSQTIQVQGTANEVNVSPNTPQDLSANRTFQIGLTDDVTITNDLNVGNNLDVTGNAQVDGDATATGDVTGDNLTAQNLIKINSGQTVDPTLANGIYIKNESGHQEMHFRYHSHDLNLSTLTEELTSGILVGGELSVANATQFTIQAGRGIIVDLRKTSSASPYPDVEYIDWNTQTITVSGLDSNNPDQLNAWVYIDANGVVQQQSTPFSDSQYKNSITVGSVIHSAGAARFARTFPVTAYGNSSQFNQFIRLFGPLKREGHIISANGANLSLDRSSGKAFALGRNYSTDPNSPSDIIDGAKTQCVIHRYYQDGSGGFVKDDGPNGQGYTTIDPLYYDGGTGTLQPVSNNKFSVQRVFYFPSTPNILIVYYGRAEYDTKDVAERSLFLEEFQESQNTAQQAIHVATIVVKKQCTNLQIVDDAHIYQAGLFRNLSATFSGGVDATAGINDLIDVNINSPVNGDVLTYDSYNQRWINAESTGGGGDIGLYGMVDLLDVYYATNL